MKVQTVDIRWHAELPVFASPGYLRTVSPDYGWIGGFDGSRTMVCLLPYSVIRKSIFHLIRFPIETIRIDPDLDIGQERAFLNAVIRHLGASGADLVIPATFNSVFRTSPDGAAVAPFGSYVLDLCRPEDALWQGLHQKHRNVIRNAIKKGVTVQSGVERIDVAHRLIHDAFGRTSGGWITKTRTRFRLDPEALRRQVMALGEFVRVLVAEYEGIPQACAIIPFSNHGAYYMHGGSISNPVTGATNLLHWEAIRLFRSLGVRQYDFFGARINPEPGSRLEGIMRFKERFGGTLIQGFAWKIGFHPFKSALYTLAARIRSGGDLVDQEQRKLASIGNPAMPE